MNDADIIKALECCLVECNCANCPLYEDKYMSKECVEIEIRALDLINRQKAEIERLKKELIEQQLKNNMLYETAKEIKSEAIKEFAESLRNKFFNYYDGLTENTSKSCHNGDSLMFYEVADMIVDCIDSLVKEMTEGK